MGAVLKGGGGKNGYVKTYGKRGGGRGGEGAGENFETG